MLGGGREWWWWWPGSMLVTAVSISATPPSPGPGMGSHYTTGHQGRFLCAECCSCVAASCSCVAVYRSCGVLVVTASTDSRAGSSSSTQQHSAARLELGSTCLCPDTGAAAAAGDTDPGHRYNTIIDLGGRGCPILYTAPPAASLVLGISSQCSPLSSSVWLGSTWQPRPSAQVATPPPPPQSPGTTTTAPQHHPAWPVLHNVW